MNRMLKQRWQWSALLVVILMLVPLLMPTRAQAASCTYTVRPGDTLSRIAREYDTTVAELLDLNPQITNPNVIRVGQVLNVPCEGEAPPEEDEVEDDFDFFFPEPTPAPVRPVPPPPADLAADLVARAHDATFNIRYPINRPLFWGSAVMVGNDGRTFFTAFHVVQNIAGTRSPYVAIGPFADWHYTAEIIAMDRANDIAILRVREPDFPGFGTLPLGSSEVMEEGDPVYTSSYPGTEAALITSKGSLLERIDIPGYDYPFILTDAFVNFGSSGGVAMNQDGEVIGMLDAVILHSGVLADMGYPTLKRASILIPVEPIKALLATVK